MRALPLLALLALVGCGGWQRVHLPIATALVEAQAQSETVIRDARTRDMREARVAAREAGEDVEAAVRAAGARRVWTCAVAAHRAYAGAVGVYLAELVAALDDEEPGIVDRLVSMLGPVAEAYRAISECGDLDLPALPSAPTGGGVS